MYVSTICGSERHAATGGALPVRFHIFGITRPESVADPRQQIAIARPLHARQENHARRIRTPHPAATPRRPPVASPACATPTSETDER